MNIRSGSKVPVVRILLPALLIVLAGLLTACPEILAYPDLMKPVARYSFYTSSYAHQVDRWLVSSDPDEPRRLNVFDLENKEYVWSSTLLPDCMVVAGSQDYIYAYPAGCSAGAPLELLTLDAHTGEILSRTDASAAGNVATLLVPPEMTSDRLFVPLKDGTKVAVFALGPSGPSWKGLLTAPNAESSQAKIVALSTSPDGDLFLGVGYESCEATLPTIFRMDVANNLVVWQAKTETCDHRRIFGPAALAYSYGLIFASAPNGLFILDAEEGNRKWDFYSDEIRSCGWTVAEGHAVSCSNSSGGESYYHVNLDPNDIYYEYYPCGNTGLYFSDYAPALILNDVYYLLTNSGILAFDIVSTEPLSLPGTNDHFLTGARYLMAYGGSIWAAGDDGLLEFKPLR